MRKLCLPEFDGTNPFAHLDFVFDQYARLKNAKATINGFRMAKNNYVKYIRTIFDPDRDGDFDIRIYWDQFSFLNYANYLTYSEYGKSIASSNRNSHLYRVRAVMLFAQQNDLTKTNFFLNVRIEEAVRETDLYEPYPPDQDSKADDVLKKEVELTKSLVLPQNYVRRNVGVDPRMIKMTPGPGCNPFRVRENQIWYFENVMNCIPIYSSKLTTGAHKKFFKGIGNSQMFYSSIGIIPFPTNRVMSAIALSLIRILGLNVGTALSLKTTSLLIDENGSATLEGFKARSGGDIDIIISKEDYEEVRGLIDIALNLTRFHRPDGNDILFIAVKRGKVVEISNRTLIKTCNFLRNHYKLDFNLSAARLRASFGGRLFRSDKPFLEKQNRMNHGTTQTTIGYGSRNQLEPDYQREVSNAFERMFMRAKNSDQSKIYKTQIGYCINPYKPSFLSGELKLPCKSYNKCLSCANYRVTQNDLHSLFRFYLNISSSAEFQKRRLPNQEDYENTVLQIASLFLSGAVLDKTVINESMSRAISLKGEVIDPVVEK
jgi:hypothetical protein